MYTCTCIWVHTPSRVKFWLASHLQENNCHYPVKMIFIFFYFFDKTDELSFMHNFFNSRCVSRFAVCPLTSWPFIHWFSYCTYFGSVKIVQSCLCRFYFAQPRVLATNFHSHSCFRYYLIRHVIVLVFHQPSFYFQGLGKMGLLKRPVGQIAHLQNSIFLSCHFWVNFKTVSKH